jgi:hypothetical protein
MANTVKLGLRNVDQISALAGAGTTQGAGTALTGSINVVSSADASNVAVVLPSQQQAPILCRATSLDGLSVFPPSGGTINGGSTNAAVALAQNKVGLYIPHPNGLDYTFQLGA